MVRVVLHGHLRRFVAGEPREVELDAAGTTARALLRALGVPYDEAAAVIVDDEQEELDRVLRDGEIVELVPAISGGTGAATSRPRSTGRTVGRG